MATIKAKSGTLTLGASGQSVVLASGASMTGQNYPAFYVYLSSSQSVSTGVATKVEFDTETFDTDSCYDNVTNYRFTPTVAGKYFVFSQLGCENSSNTIATSNIQIFKNGSLFSDCNFAFDGTSSRRNCLNINSIIDMNGTTDYLEIFGIVNFSSGTGEINSSTKQSYFGAYRIGD